MVPLGNRLQCAVLFLDGSNQCDVMMSRLLKSPWGRAAFSVQDGDKRSRDGTENGGEKEVGDVNFFPGLYYAKLTLGGAHDLQSADEDQQSEHIKQFGEKRLGNMTSWFN